MVASGRGGRGGKEKHKGVFRAGKIPYGIMMADTWRRRFVQTRRAESSKSEPSCEPWALVTGTCLRGLFSCNEGTVLVGALIVGELGVYGSSLCSPLNFAMTLKLL